MVYRGRMIEVMGTTTQNYIDFNIKTGVSLKAMNTFRLDIKSKYYSEVCSISHLKTLLSSRYFKSNKVVVLGSGSNTLFSKDFDGLVLKIAIKGIRVVREDAQHLYLEANAGEDWPNLVRFVVSKGWGGIENLAMVPGTVGAAPIQNIACYGHNFNERLISLDALDVKSGALRRFSAKECKFGYRDSIFKQELRNQFIIINIRLKLDKKPVINTSYKSRYESVEEELSRIAQRPYDIRDVYQAIVNIRERKLPDISKVGSAGSIFKNPVVSRAEFLRIQSICPGLHYYPVDQLTYTHIGMHEESVVDSVKIPAAWLIEEMGWAGKRIGNCGIWRMQPLNIVNYDKATPQELLSFIQIVIDAIYHKYGIVLEHEVEIV